MTRYVVSFRRVKSRDSDQGHLNNTLLLLPITVTVLNTDEDSAVEAATLLARGVLGASGLSDAALDSIILIPEVDFVIV